MRRIETTFPISDNSGSGISGSGIKLQYFIRKEMHLEGEIKTRCYGIVVLSSSGEREHIRAVTTNERTAQRLLRLMARCRVTPLTARDIVYDWLCERDGLTGRTGKR